MPSHGGHLPHRVTHDALAVLNESPVRTREGPHGKTVAVTTLRDLTQVAVMAWIDQNGGDSKAVRFIEMSPSSIGPAILDARIDCGFLGEPFLTQDTGKCA